MLSHSRRYYHRQFQNQQRHLNGLPRPPALPPSRLRLFASAALAGVPVFWWARDSLVGFCRIRGTSMEPELRHGDVVLVRKSDLGSVLKSFAALFVGDDYYYDDGDYGNDNDYGRGGGGRIDRRRRPFETSLRGNNNNNGGGNPYYQQQMTIPYPGALSPPSPPSILYESPPLALPGHVVVYKNPYAAFPFELNVKRVVGIGGQWVRVIPKRGSGSNNSKNYKEEDDVGNNRNNGREQTSYSSATETKRQQRQQKQQQQHRGGDHGNENDNDDGDRHDKDHDGGGGGYQSHPEEGIVRRWTRGKMSHRKRNSGAAGGGAVGGVHNNNNSGSGSGNSPSPFGNLRRADERVQAVPPFSLYVEGDNAANSVDSRDIGPVGKNLLVGVAEYVVWPPTRWKRLRRRPPHDHRADTPRAFWP